MGEPLADDPFGHGEVDHPATSVGAVREPPRHAEDQDPGQLGQRLRACAQADRVAAHHPGPVLDNVPSPDRSDAEDNRQEHGRPEQKPQPIKEFTVAVRPGIEMGHPQTRKRGAFDGHPLKAGHLFVCHSELPSERKERYNSESGLSNNRFFAEFILERSEGLRMTRKEWPYCPALSGRRICLIPFPPRRTKAIDRKQWYA